MDQPSLFVAILGRRISIKKKSVCCKPGTFIAFQLIKNKVTHEVNHD